LGQLTGWSLEVASGVAVGSRVLYLRSLESVPLDARVPIATQRQTSESNASTTGWKIPS
jgi:hypothetical protein